MGSKEVSMGFYLRFSSFFTSITVRTAPQKEFLFPFRSRFWRDFGVLRSPNLAVILSTAGGRSVSPFSANFLGLCFGKISLCVVAAGVGFKLVGSSTVMHCEKVEFFG